VYVHNIGWLDWTSNGKVAGSKGYFFPIESIEVKLQEKNKSDVQEGNSPYRETSTNIKYQTHVSYIGWQPYVNNGEETIINNLKELRKGKTTILIAHRITTVKKLDKIIVMDDGKIVGYGTHDELESSCPLYQNMVYLQRLEDDMGEDNE
jgi:uncharacterized protein YjdB